MAQTNDDRPCERRQINHARWFESFLRIPHHVTQHQTTFGIGVDHLYRVAFHGGDHIPRAHRIAGGHVFNQPDQPHHIRLGPAQRKRAHHARHNASAAHIHSHVFHAASGFQADPTRIKHYTLAD